MGRFDEYDDELKTMKDEKIQAKFSINFKKLDAMVVRIIEETKDYDDKYPKSELMKIWGCAALAMYVLFGLSHSIFLVVTLPFLFFYFFVMIQVGTAWKRFKYKTGKYWLMTIVTIMGGIIFGLLCQQYLWR